MHAFKFRSRQCLVVASVSDHRSCNSSRVITFALLLCVSFLVQAQSTFDGYTHRIRTASSIQKLGPDLFGDATNMVDGSTTFSVTDVSLPTNGTLPLAVGRVFRVDSQVADQQGRTTYTGSAVFGPYWDLDVPYMVGTFDATRGWVGAEAQPGVYPQTEWVKRCTLGGGGPPSILGVGQFGSVTYQTSDFFSGIHINVPGKGMEEMLSLTSGTFSNQTIGGHTYYYQTKDNWLVGCLGSIKNGVSGTATSGEGFVVWRPDGSSYNFDWMVTRVSPYILDDSCGVSADIFPSSSLESSGTVHVCTSGIAVPRYQVFLYATKATDRFGNTITYTYDPNIPEHLTSVSSEGESINLTYGSNGHVASITAGSRQWHYVYSADARAQLTSVILPDGSQWSFDYGQNAVGVTRYLSKQIWWNCLLNIGSETTDAVPAAGDTNVVTMTHPSGATGAFTFRKILHGTRQAESTCHLVNMGGDGQTTIVPQMAGPTSDYQTASLVQKTLTIPGAQQLQWTYRYHPGWTAPYQSVTTATDSAGNVSTFTYGTDSSIDYGQLLQETITDARGVVLRTITHKYLNIEQDPNIRQNFVEWPGIPLNINEGWEDGFHIRNRPEYSTTITQQGKSFFETVDTGCPSAGVYCFDSLVRPTRVIRSSQ